MSKILANEIANYGDNAPIELKEGLNIPADKPLQAAGVTGSNGQVLTSTGSTVEWTTPFDGNYNSLTNLPTIPAAQVRSDWDAVGTIAEILNKPVVPAQPSVSVASPSANGNLTYNQGNGLFTFTPPDLSPYALTTSLANSNNWDTAYSWGDHSLAGYATTVSLNSAVANSGNWDTAYSWGDHSVAGYLTSFTETDPVFAASDAAAVTAAKISNWDTAYGWGDHSTQGYITGLSVENLDNVDVTGLSDQQILKWDAASSSWKAANDLVGGQSAIELSDLSVTVAAAGSANLSYNNTNGVFTYTPPDLSGYLTSFTETDPVFSASPASNIISQNITNWNLAYGWGNHASAGYATTTQLNTAVANSANWDLAYSWGDHSLSGYLTSYTETDTLDTVTGRGASTTNSVSLGGIQLGTLTQITNSFGNQNTLTFGGDMTIFHMQDGIYGTTNRIIVDEYNLIIGTKGESPDNYYNNLIEVNVGNDLGSTSNTADVRLGFGNVGTRLQTTASGVTITGALTAGGLTYPTTNGTSGDVLTSDGAGNVTWVSPVSASANVVISDTAPGSPTAGDLWWESDRGRLKIYYNDTDSSQWVDASPPLAQPNVPVAAGFITLNGTSPTWTGTTGYTVSGAQPGGAGTDYEITLTFPTAYSARTDYIVQATYDGTNYIGANGAQIAVARGTSSVVFTPRRWDENPLSLGEIMITITNL